VTRGVRIVLAPDVGAEVVARDGCICREKDVNWIVDCRPTCNDSGIVAVEVAVNHLDVTLDKSTVGRKLSQVGTQRFGGGNGVDGCQCHYFLVEQWGIHYIINPVLVTEGEETNASSWGECCKDALSHHRVVLARPLLELCPSRFAEELALGSK
jgi:hypothetical protein